MKGAAAEDVFMAGNDPAGRSNSRFAVALCAESYRIKLLIVILFAEAQSF